MWDATTVRSEAGGLDQVQLRELVHGGKLGPVEAMQGFLRAWREGVWTPGAFTEPASNRRGNFAPHLAASWILMGLKNRSGGAVSDTSHTAIALQLQAGMDPAEIRVRGDSNLAADLENGRASYLQSPVRVERGGAWPEDDSGSARLFTPEELLETLRSYELEQLRRDGPLLPNPNVTVHGDLADDVPADTVAVFYESPPGANYAETIQELTRGLATRVGGSSQVVGAQHDGATADGYRARVRLLTGAADRAPQELTTSAGTWARVTPGNDGGAPGTLVAAGAAPAAGALALLALDQPLREDDDERATDGLLAGAREGLAVVWTTPRIRLLLAAGVGVNVLVVPLPQVVLPTLGRETFASALSLTALLGGFRGGAVAGNWMVGRLEAARWRTYAAGVLAVGAATALTGGVGVALAPGPGLGAGLAVVVAGVTVVGAFQPLYNVTGSSLLQDAAPERRRGRVVTLVNSLLQASFPVPLLAAGAALTVAPPFALLVVQGAGLLVLGAALGLRVERGADTL